ncbi:hypothetical protein EMCRGX_G031285 [Ephydatia muelleri]|eukprot:Em0018g708a
MERRRAATSAGEYRSPRTYSTLESRKVSSARTSKIIFLGNLGVGKTALFNRIRTGSYMEDSNTISRIDRCNKTFQLSESDSIVLDIWDTGGTEAYRTVTTNYYRNAQAVILVYDVTDERSVHELAQWISDAQIYAPSAICMMLGNKMDLQSGKETLRRSENAANSADQLAREYDIKLHFKVSAKDDTAVRDALDTLAHELCGMGTRLPSSPSKIDIMLKEPLPKSWRRRKLCSRQ